MNYNDYEMDVAFRERELQASAALPALMRKVYVWMTLALAITGFTAYAVAATPNLQQIISWGINKLSLTTATLLFVLYSVINGATLSVIFVAYSIGTISKVFFITAGTFAVMAFIGYVTKTDLTKLGKILFMALIGIIIATVVNIFVKSSGLDLILSYLGVLVFVGLTAYDTQKIKQMLWQAGDMSEGSQKIALLGALSLYLDFINLFLYLLRIFGRRE